MKSSFPGMCAGEQQPVSGGCVLEHQVGAVDKTQSQQAEVLCLCPYLLTCLVFVKLVEELVLLSSMVLLQTEVIFSPACVQVFFSLRWHHSANALCLQPVFLQPLSFS